MQLVDMDSLWQCETCFHHKSYGCDTWCDTGEAYRPSASKLKVIDAVEVVRCGTPCRWLYDEPDDYCCMNHKGLAEITPDSFCSYGRRVEENAAD